MKRFWVFEGTDYYPVGGAEDVHQGFDTLEEAIKAADASETVKAWKAQSMGWAHVWDAEADAIVYKVGQREYP